VGPDKGRLPYLKKLKKKLLVGNISLLRLMPLRGISPVDLEK